MTKAELTGNNMALSSQSIINNDGGGAMRGSCLQLFRFASVAFCLILAACSGGGGGGGGSDDSSGAATISLSTNTLTFSTPDVNSTPPPQLIQATVTGGSGGTLYIKIVSTGPAVASISNVTITSSTTGQATVYPASAKTLGVGTFSSTITVYACTTDPNCTSGQLRGSPQTVNVTYQIGGLVISPSGVSLSAINGTSPMPVSVNVDNVRGSAPWTSSTSYSGGATNWLSVSPSSGGTLPATLSFGGSPQAPGVYTATVTINSGSLSLPIPVTYTVREPLIGTMPASLAFSAISHDSAAPVGQSLTLGTEADLPVSYSTRVDYGAGASGWLTVLAMGSAPGTVTVGVNTTNLNAGTYTATLMLMTATQNLSIPISYTLRAPQISHSPMQLNFSAFRLGTAPSAQNVTIGTENNIGVPYTTSVTYSPGASSWLTVPASSTAPGSLPVAVSTTNLLAGSYTASIVVQPAYGAASFTVGVTYQVRSVDLTLTPGQLAYMINNNSVTADLTKVVAAGDTGLPVSWTAASSVPWLSVGTASGATAGDGTTSNLSLSLVSSELEKLDTGTHTGNVTFIYTRPDMSVAALQLPVTLQMNVPRVQFVAPYVAIADTANSLIIRGRGFTGLTSNDVLFGSTRASAISVVSNTEIRATVGALGAGTYPVTIANQLGLNRSQANLEVVAPRNYGAVAFASAGAKARAVFDDERRAVYVLNRDAVTIERYSYDAGTSTWAVNGLSLPQLRDIALSTDGAQLFAVSDGAVRIIDPLGLVQTQAIPFSTLLNVYLRQIAFANNGKAILGTGYYGSGYTTVYQYDMLSQAVSPLRYSPTSAFTVSRYYTPLGSSADGSRVVMGDGGISPPQLIGYYDAGTDSIDGPGAPARDLFTVVLNRNATRMILNAVEVFDGNLALLGNLPNTTVAAVLSPDGTIAYTYDASGTVRKFNLNGALIAGVFPEIGTGTIPVGAPISNPWMFTLAMAISLDGNTLVIAGDQKVVIMPAP